MATVIKFDHDEVEKILREEVARRYHSEVVDVEFLPDDELIEVTLGATIPQRGGPGDR